MKTTSLLIKLICGIILGSALGYLSQLANLEAPIRALATFSSIFGSFLGFIIPLVIASFVTVSICHLGNKAGKLLSVTVIIAYISTILAGLAAIWVGLTILPSFISEVAPATEYTKVAPYFQVRMTPLLGVMEALVLAFIIGLGGATLKSKRLLDVMVDFQSIIAKVISRVIIPLIPIYVAGTFSKLVFTGQISQTLASFLVVFLFIITLQYSFVLLQYTVVWIVDRKAPPWKTLKNMLPSYLTAFGTQSSTASIPVNLESVAENGVDKDICDFVVPLCATIHIAGDTITLVLSSIAMILMSGDTASFAQLFPFVLMLGVTMIAAPGIPGGGVMAALGIIESMLGFGKLQQSLMIALHFSQDSFGTATNVTGDGAIAILVNKFYKKQQSS